MELKLVRAKLNAINKTVEEHLDFLLDYMEAFLDECSAYGLQLKNDVEILVPKVSADILLKFLTINSTKSKAPELNGSPKSDNELTLDNILSLDVKSSCEIFVVFVIPANLIINVLKFNCEGSILSLNKL